MFGCLTKFYTNVIIFLYGVNIVLSNDFSIDVNNVSWSHIEVSWNPPSPSNKTAIIGYEIRCCYYKNKTNCPVIKDLSNVTTSYIVTGLVAATKYTIFLRAKTNSTNVTNITTHVTKSTKEDAPTKAQNLTAVKTGTQSVTLSWDEPSEKNGVVQYRVYYQDLSNNSNSLILFATTKLTNVTVTELEEYITYKFAVQSFTGAGNGSAIEINKTTHATAPDGPPLNFKGKNITSTSVYLSWEKPEFYLRNGIIQNYSIVKKKKEAEYFEEPITVNITSHLVNLLEPYSNYSFKITAYNQIGHGPHTTLNISTLQDAPSKPRNVRIGSVMHNSVSLIWAPPEKNNGILLGYEVWYCNLNLSSMCFKSQNLTSDKESHNFTNLVPYTVYTFYINAFTKAGASENVNKTTETSEHIPGPIQNLTVTAINPRNISLTWKKPYITNGIVYYKIFYKELNKENSSDVYFKNTSSLDVVVTGLEEYICYEFTVQAFTMNGGHGSRRKIQKRTEPDVPSGPPLHIQAEANSSTSIQLSWHAPDFYKINGIIQNYFIKFISVKKSGKNAHVGNVSTSPNNTVYLINQLWKYTKYNITVQAVNQVGKGPTGLAIETTLQDVPGPPKSLVCSYTSANIIMLIWEKPLKQNGEITNYRVNQTDGALNIMTTFVYNETVLSSRYDKLHPYRMYNYTLEAATKIGWGESISTMCKTNESTPAMPALLRTTSVSARNISVAWSQPKENFGVIINYEVRLFPVENKTVLFVDNITSTSYNFSTEPYTTYNISVRAQTIVGFGPLASISVFTNESAPSEVATLTLESKTTTVSVSWSSPLKKNGIVYYRIFLRFANLTETSDNLIKDNILDNDRIYGIEGLQEFVNYTISIQAYTKAGNSSKTSKTIQTDSAAPSAGPRNFKSVTTSQTYVTLSWNPPLEADRNGVIDYYRIFYKKNNKTITELSKDGYQKQISNLSMYVNYTFYIAAHNEKGYGPNSTVTIETLQGLPTPPILMENYSNTSVTSIRICWRKPDPLNGVLTGYALRYIAATNSSDAGAKYPRPTDTSWEIKNLDSYTLYNISLYAITIGDGPPDMKQYHTSSASPAGPPKDIKVDSKTSSSITLTWNQPEKPNGKILKYIVSYRTTNIREPLSKDVSSNTKYTIEDLNPNTYYEVQVACESEGGTGPYSVGSRIQTEITSPPPPPTVVTPTLLPTWHTITINLWKASDMYGSVKFYYIVVLEASKDAQGKPMKPSRTPDSYKNNEIKTYEEYVTARGAGNIYPYITARLTRQEVGDGKLFVIGNGETSSRTRRTVKIYTNGPLYSQSTYFYSQRAHSSENLHTSDKQWGGPYVTGKKPVDLSSSPAGAIAGGIVTAIVIILIIAAAVYYYRKRFFQPGRKPSYEPGNTNETFELDEPVHRPSAHPIKVENFSAYVRNLSKDGKYLFSEEFKLIQNGRSGYSCMYEHSNHPINRDKNRYNNIVAYDHTRVLLKPTEGIPESDYINANYIDGYNGQSSYIATQGPLENTCDDFWRMCWEQNVSSVVMLTGLEENGRIKCYQYWPEVGSICYGRMQVTLTESNYLPNYVVRSFSLLHSEYPGTERFIRHFSILTWRDHSTANSQELLAFIRRVNQETQGSGPVAVHCSAGVGRTGTYITVDVNLQRITSERNVEVYNYLQHIRSQRNYMVQTEAQYIFIHDTLLEYLTFGVTEVQVRDLRDYIKKLKQPADGGAEMNVDKEFHKLNLFDQSSSKTMNAANAICNKSKNRFLNVLPYDDTRVALRQLPGLQGSDYINANYIHGYSQAKQFIATQAPLPQTIPAFWRMIWEHHCTTIVCLAQETEGGKVKIHRYWPSIEAAMHGPLMIENMTENDMGDYIVRDFKVTHTTEGHSRNIKHFQYIAWPDNAYPDSASGLVDMIGRVQKWHQQNSIGQAVIHCSAGVGRTGVFIALFNMLERVRGEGVVDVFQTVRGLRTQRPAMVQTKVEYLFCYLALQEFLASFDIYQNFA
ncbi:receptor-type tyrosine-protein phosphatase S-like isoform X2 [Hydractinia symbiolongicarpus]|uniref:receptor-type tyrosine-protein phosphatase S-like isoform X2 n=1 Tax=Hydractinia symbiolongicarpus TaxID=13093 RepID=UPI00254C770F|nr:receptor-type tyrosine-protein phosphatase S-like isoform X2 [Hydractinia symbiolongicarpus]